MECLQERSAYNGNGPDACNSPDVPVRHGDFCACIWCLQGVK